MSRKKMLKSRFKMLKYLLGVTLFFTFWGCNEETDNYNCPPMEISADFDKNKDIYILGDFNNWTAVDKMEYKNGKWRIKLKLPPGNYAYMFYSKKDKKRYLDKNNYSVIYSDGIRASKLKVKNCYYPDLLLKDFKKYKNGYEFSVEYRGVEEIDFKKSKIYLNGEETKDFIFKNSIFYIKGENKSNGKYSYLFKIFDKKGHGSNSLFVPVWIEDKEFNWKDAFIYQIMTDRFNNGNKSNDKPIEGIETLANWQGGDFKGIIEKLESGYFDEIGANAIWISSPVLNTSKAGKGMGADNRYYAPYHSYWPVATGWTDFNHLDVKSPIEPHFGTVEELKNLVELAHKKGIRIIFDVIPNHVHTDSFMWRKYNSEGWFHLDKNQNPYICGWEQPVICWFNRFLADINHKNDKADEFVINHLIWLAKEFNVDGFRIDAVRLMITDFTINLNYAVKNELEKTGIEFYMLGENYTSEIEENIAFDVIGEYLGDKKLRGLFNFPLYHHLSRTFFLWNESLSDFRDFLKYDYNSFRKNYYDESLMANFLGNHDLPRAISIANGDFSSTETNGGILASERVWQNRVKAPVNEIPYKKLTMAQVVVFTLYDIPVIYQGDEFGLPGANDPDNRRFMKFNEDLNEFQKRTLDDFKKISKFRKEHPASGALDIHTLYISDDVWIYYKKHNDDIVMVALNRSEKELTVNININEPDLKDLLLEDIFTKKIYNIKSGVLRLEFKPLQSIVLTLR